MITEVEWFKVNEKSPRVNHEILTVDIEGDRLDDCVIN